MIAEYKNYIITFFSLVIFFTIGAEIVLATEYSVTVENWHVTFDANDTVYTKTQWNEPKDISNNGYYTIWVAYDPNADMAARSSAILLFTFNNPSPVDRTWLEGYTKGLLSPFNETPLISGHTIDGEKGIVCEGWSTADGRIVYGAMYPVDPATDNTAQKFVGFISLLDRNTSYEILNSLHVEYSVKQATSSALNSQPAQTAPYTRRATGTRDDPVPIGTTIDLGDAWQIRVLQVYPDATNMVLRENQFNDPPKPGNQFFIARVRAKYTGSGSDTFGGSYRLRAVGPSSVGYSTFENSPGAISDPLPDSEVFSGGVIEGNVGWEIKSSDASSLVMYDNPISFGDSKDRMYMALYGGPVGSSSPSTFSNDQEWATRGTGRMGRY